VSTNQDPEFKDAKKAWTFACEQSPDFFDRRQIIEIFASVYQPFNMHGQYTRTSARDYRDDAPADAQVRACREFVEPELFISCRLTEALGRIVLTYLLPEYWCKKQTQLGLARKFGGIYENVPAGALVRTQRNSPYYIYY